jgi:hypothetical protein
MAVKKPTATKPSSKSGKQVPSPKGRLAKATKASPVEDAGDLELTIDRRRGPRREESDLVVAPAKLERRTKVQRRRQIDPTTCERDYSDEEVAFMNAMDEYKRTSGRMFPTCSEVLEVIRSLGYVKLSLSELALVRPEAANPIDGHELFESDEADADELEFEAL